MSEPIKIDSILAGAKSSQRIVLFMVLLTSFLPPFMGSSVNIALPSIARELNMDAVLMSWIATAYLLTTAMAVLPMGRLADIYGRRKVFTLGLIVFTLGLVVAGLAMSPLALILARCIQGVGSAMIFGTGLALLTSVYAVGERGKVIGLTSACVYFGLTMGPFLGGLITHHASWRFLFIFPAPLAAISIWLSAFKLKGEWADDKDEKFDLAGAAVYCLSLPLLIYGFSVLPSSTGIILIVVGISGLSAFIHIESKTKNPLLHIELFTKNTVFALSNLAAFIHYSASFSTTFLLSLYLQYIKGLPPHQAGLVLIASPVIMAAFSPIAGRLSDTIEPRILSSMGMALTALVLFVFSFLSASASLFQIIVLLIMGGFGFALFASPNTNAVMSSVEKRDYGLASGTLATMRLIGQIVSMGTVMILFALLIGRVRITPEYYDEFLSALKSAFIIFSILCFLGIFASLARGKMHAAKPDKS